ncbi:acetylcholine receptor protein alpha [Plakobranchus ocellatus]|uniref:Acetylcholine receptor protein alpha n=1 Tax=Plakobranchus ocellatus TaxID=259542 RepID=A0AAV4CXC2_9GAST|nr:acetylcholine receptor protein alpha [Plakobranchus ocellatus]
MLLQQVYPAITSSRLLQLEFTRLQNCLDLANIHLLYTFYSQKPLKVTLDSAGGSEKAGYQEAEFYKPHMPKDRSGLEFIPDEQRLLDYIMRGYERSVRPVRNASSPVIIQMGLTLTQVLDMVRFA